MLDGYLSSWFLHRTIFALQNQLWYREKDMETKEVAPQTAADALSEEMMRAGLHFGHSTSKTHPNMRPYIAGVRNTVHVIDVKFTHAKLQEALAFLSKFHQEGKKILLVGTRISVRELVREAAKACNLPFVADRWIGGTLTNFDMTRKRLEELKELGQAREQGAWQKYTTKEKADLLMRMNQLEERFGGIKQLTGSPDALFVCDLDENEIAVREAKKLGIPVVAIVDTNNDPERVDYPIPANNDAPSAVSYILEKVKDALLKAQPVV